MSDDNADDIKNADPAGTEAEELAFNDDIDPDLASESSAHLGDNDASDDPVSEVAMRLAHADRPFTDHVCVLCVCVCCRNSKRSKLAYEKWKRRPRS